MQVLTRVLSRSGFKETTVLGPHPGRPLCILHVPFDGGRTRGVRSGTRRNGVDGGKHSCRQRRSATGDRRVVGVTGNGTSGTSDVTISEDVRSTPSRKRSGRTRGPESLPSFRPWGWWDARVLSLFNELKPPKQRRWGGGNVRPLEQRLPCPSPSQGSAPPSSMHPHLQSRRPEPESLRRGLSSSAGVKESQGDGSILL